MLDLLRRYTEECPSLVFTSPEEERRLLLVKPVNFETLIKFSPGISIFKASYGRGKTYGVGYYTTHYCTDPTNGCSAVYINLRELREYIDRVLTEKAELRDKLYEELRTSLNKEYYASLLYGLARAKDLSKFYEGTCLDAPRTSFANRVALMSSRDALNITENEVLEIVRSGGQVTDTLRRIFDLLVSRSKNKLYIILDEFEKGISRNPDPSEIYGFITTLLESLRPGVLDNYPNRFVMILTVQEMLYPSDQMRVYRRNNPPVLGKIIATDDDLSISIRTSMYDERAIQDYYKKSLDLLRKTNFIEEENYLALSEIAPCVGVFGDPIRKLPSRLFFDRLRDIIVNKFVVDREVREAARNWRESKTKRCSELKDILEPRLTSFLNENTIFKLYVSREVVGIEHETIKRMLENLAEKTSERFQAKIVSKDWVNAKGYEGLVVFEPEKIKIYMYKNRSVKGAEVSSYTEKVMEKYKEYLKQCQPKSKQEKDPGCPVIVLHPEEVNLGLFLRELERKNRIEGNQVRFNIIDVPLDRDELTSLIIPVSNLPHIIGDRQYFEERLNEITDKIVARIKGVQQ